MKDRMPSGPGTKREQGSPTEKEMSSSFIESAAFWKGVITVGATAIAALAGSLSWYFSNKVSDAKESELLRYQTESKVAIAEANARAAEANEKAERERLARVRLEESIAPRRLTKDQRDVVASKLRGFSGQVVSLWYGSGDKEAETFAWELASSLDKAGWKVFSPASQMTLSAAGKPFGSTSPLETGVTVVSTGDASSLDASKALVQALTVLGYDATKSSRIEERNAPVVIVNVEVRPEGPQGRAKLRAKDN